MKKLFVLFLMVATSACAALQTLNTFTSGELSPHLDARVDFEKYSSGCRTLENFIVLPYGGALKRPGTQFIAETKSNGIARLAPFSVGVDQTYVMEIGDKYIRFYRDGIQLLTTSGVPVEVATPYSSNDVFRIQLAQFADIIYMVHPNYPVYLLERTSTTPTFSMTKVVYDWPPVLDENITTATITPSATTGSVLLTASSAIFSTNHVQSDWVLRSARTGGKINESAKTASFTSTAIRVEGGWNLKTSGNWAGILTLQVSQDNKVSWGDYREYTSDSSAYVNYDRDGTETEAGVYYRLVFAFTSGSLTYTLQNTEPYLSGWLTVTNYLSSTQVQALVNIELGSTQPSEFWSEGAFSAARGYPRAVEFFENRLFFGGTDYLVNTIWSSMTDDYQNFKTGTYDDSALRLSLNSDNIIEWMLSRSQLFIGTLGDEWTVSGGDSATPLSPSAILARKQTSFGSKDGMDALVASDSILYLQRQGRKLREFEYSLETDSYKSQDTSLLAEHITKGGIVQISEQQQPEPIVWAVRGDGQLIGLTFNKAQNVYGWHRQVTDGKFKSLACIPSDGEDRIYVVVQRTIGSVTNNYIEWFRPFDWGDDEDAWFVDSGLDFDGGESIPAIFTVDTNGYVTVVCNNVLTNGNQLNVVANGVSNFNSKTFIVTNATSTNFMLASLTSNLFQFVPNLIYVTNAGNSDINGIYTNSGAYWKSKLSRLDYTDIYGFWVLITISNYVNASGGDYAFEVGLGANLRYIPYLGLYNAVAFSDVLPYPNVFYQTIFTGTVQRVQKTFTNVQHLAGKTLAVYADSGTQPNATVDTNGVLTLPEYHNRVIVGLPYTARLSPMYLDSVSSQGSTYAKVKNPYRAHFRVNDSGTFNYGTETNKMFPVSVRLPSLTAGNPVPFFSGDPTTKPINAEAETAPEFWVTSTEPLPLELLSLTIFTDVKEYE